MFVSIYIYFFIPLNKKKDTADWFLFIFAMQSWLIG
jgi:hypothetical protein